MGKGFIESRKIVENRKEHVVKTSKLRAPLAKQTLVASWSGYFTELGAPPPPDQGIGWNKRWQNQWTCKKTLKQVPNKCRKTRHKAKESHQLPFCIKHMDHLPAGKRWLSPQTFSVDIWVVCEDDSSLWNEMDKNWLGHIGFCRE